MLKHTCVAKLANIQAVGRGLHQHNNNNNIIYCSTHILYEMYNGYDMY